MIPNYQIRQLTAEFTRPANTTPYSVGDVISAGTTPITFPHAARFVAGAGGSIESALLISSVAAATALQADLYLFDTSFTIDADNAVFAPTDSQIKSLVAIVPLYNTVTMGDLTNTNPPAKFASSADHPLSVNTVIQVSDLDIVYQCASGSANLFGVLVARNAYTPASNEVITIKLGVDRD